MRRRIDATCTSYDLAAQREAAKGGTTLDIVGRNQKSWKPGAMEGDPRVQRPLNPRTWDKNEDKRDIFPTATGRDIEHEPIILRHPH